jgi:beta-galactosidase GanA
MFLDHGRSVSYYAGSDFWIHEIESGPIGGWLLGPDHKTDEKDILNMCFETLGHDAKLLIYMPWREWLFQPLRWGALVDLQINPTPRYDAAALVGRYIKQNSSFLKKARVQKGEIALLESKNNATVLRGMGQEDQLFQAQRGAYRAFWEKGFRVDFISEKQLLTGKADDYKVICLPLMGLISADLAQSLKTYVKKGGVLVGFARCGTLDEKGWYHPELPIPDLGDVFGIDSIEADHRDDINILLNGHSYRSWINRDVVYPRESTEILAKFEDGLPAVTLSQYGKGFGVYLATQADGGYLIPQAGVISGAIELVSNRAGLSPAVSINYDNKNGREIDPHILDTPERTEILVTNYSETPREVDLSLVEPKRKVLNIRLGIIDQKLLDIKPTDAEINISFKLDPKEVQIISIDWQ